MNAFLSLCAVILVRSGDLFHLNSNSYKSKSNIERALIMWWTLLITPFQSKQLHKVTLYSSSFVTWRNSVVESLSSLSKFIALLGCRNGLSHFKAQVLKHNVMLPPTNKWINMPVPAVSYILTCNFSVVNCYLRTFLSSLGSSVPHFSPLLKDFTTGTIFTVCKM